MGDFNASLAVIKRTSIKNIYINLKNTINDKMDICKTYVGTMQSQQKTIFFSNTHGKLKNEPYFGL